MNIEDHFIQTQQGKVFVKIWSPQNRSVHPPIILLHDSLGSVELWRDFPEKLCSSLLRPIIAYDRLGFGKSELRLTLPSLNFIEEESSIYFPQIKSALKLDTYALLGHSVGGAMAVNIAASDKDCDSVITIAAQAYVEDLTLKGIIEAAHLFQQPQQFDKLAKWHGEKASWVLKAWTDTWLSPQFKDWSLQHIKDLTCPLLAIHGSEDEYGSTAFPEYLVRNSSGPARMEIIEGCKHVPHKSHTNQVLSAIQSFIEEKST